LPAVTGNYTAQLTVKDTVSGLYTTAEFVVYVGSGTTGTVSPTFSAVGAMQVATGSNAVIPISASRPFGATNNTLHLNISGLPGMINVENYDATYLRLSANILWTAPSLPGVYVLTAEVGDLDGANTLVQIPIVVYQVPIINVTSPTSGALLSTGTTKTVSWNFTGTATNFNISLINSAGTPTTIANLIVNATSSYSYNWAISSALTQGNYTLKVCGTLSGQNICKQVPIFILKPLARQYPSGGETLQMDKSHLISWTGGLPSWYVKVELLNSSNQLIQTLISSTLNDGSELLKINFTNSFSPSTNYVIRITCTNCAAGTPGAAVDTGTFKLSRPANLVLNGSIEGDKYNGWKGWTSYEKWINTEPAADGVAFAKLMVGNVARSISQDSNIAISQGKSYRATAAIKTLNVSTGNPAYAVVQWRNSSGGLLSNVVTPVFGTTTGTTSGWMRISTPPLTPPLNAYKASIAVLTAGSVSGAPVGTGEASFDDITFWEVQ
jgi:molybdopterin-binding protein